MPHDDPANHDIKVEKGDLTLFPLVLHIIKNEELEQEFEKYNVEANYCKLLYERWGKIALVLLIGALLVAVSRLTAHALHQPFPKALTYAGVLCGVTSFTREMDSRPLQSGTN